MRQQRPDQSWTGTKLENLKKVIGELFSGTRSYSFCVFCCVLLHRLGEQRVWRKEGRKDGNNSALRRGSCHVWKVSYATQTTCPLWLFTELLSESPSLFLFERVCTWSLSAGSVCKKRNRQKGNFPLSFHCGSTSLSEQTTFSSWVNDPHRVALCLSHGETLCFTALRAEEKGGTSSALCVSEKRRVSHVQGDRLSSGWAGRAGKGPSTRDKSLSVSLTR